MSVKTLTSVAKRIIAERKELEGKDLSSNHELTIKQFTDNAAWLFSEFNSLKINYNKDDSSEPVSITIGF
jgi:hypothetical protein